MSKTEHRQFHYDILRIIAAFSVVMLHGSAQFWYELPVTDADWLITNSYDALFRFGVPIFVMISGALFLNPSGEIKVKRLFTHNILRIVILYGVWSCIYGLYDCRGFDVSLVTWKDYVREMLGGRYHLWFLPMIAGIYCLIPVLHSLVKHAEKSVLQYFLVLFLVFQVGTFTLKALVWQDDLHYLLNMIDIPMACSYVGYFVLGYYIAHVGIERKYHRWIYVGGIISAVCNVVLGNLLALKKGSPIADIYDSYSIFTFFIVIALFLFFVENREHFRLHGMGEKLIREISACTLGIYVMHVGVMEVWKNAGFHPMSMPMIFGVPVFSVLCFVFCLAAAAVLRRIPLVGRYIC